MEQLMRCNIIKCRKELEQRAVVTTCSHIYCLDCASYSGLTTSGPEANRSCPACRASLHNPDDVVVTNLHPTEDYKTSVLSGLSPNIIMECAGKALSFWAYQMTQEIVYQEHVSKTLTDKYSALSLHLDKVINEANTQIGGLQNTISNLKSEHDGLQRKNDELVYAFKDKNKKLMRVEELYDKLKRKAMLGQIQDAASENVSSNIEAAHAVGTTLSEHLSQPGIYERQSDYVGMSRQHAGRDGGNNGRDFSRNSYNNAHLPDGLARQGWPRAPGPPPFEAPLTPSVHRQLGGTGLHGGLSGVSGLVSGTPRQAPGSGRMRQPVFNDNSRVPNHSGTSGVGLSAGMKSGHVGAAGTYNFATAAPRVLQRPVPRSYTSQAPDSQLYAASGDSGGVYGRQLGGP